ncbi:hypothetical protein [Streptomyces sp. NPDC056194]|uniref:hypothetical protein n=1 Tax=unclassified Streptomyces TaxID=2593676 RepID=UPI0035DF786C
MGSPRPKEPALNPDTYATLHGPAARPAPPRRGAGLALAAAALWTVALLLLGCLGFLALWAEADRGPAGGIPLRWAPIRLAVAAVPVALLCTPAVRRLSVPARALVTGLATCAIAVGLVVRAVQPESPGPGAKRPAVPRITPRRRPCLPGGRAGPAG